MKDRIRKIMESQEMTQKDFAEHLGISAASLCSIFNEKTKPTLSTVNAIMEKFPEISLEWLISGKGGMMKDGGMMQAADQEDTPAVSPTSPSSEPLDLFSSVMPAQAKPATQQQPKPAATPATQPARQVQPTTVVVKREVKEIRIFFDDGTYETFTK